MIISVTVGKRIPTTVTQ